MKQPLRFLGKHLAGAVLIAFGLIFSSFALADIISGNSSTNSSSHSTYTLLTINQPASVAPGDLLLANIDVNGGSPANVTAPSGWTQVLRTDNDTNVSMISYSKIAGASEPSSYTWTIDTQTRAEGGITQYSGVDPTNPIDASAGNTGFGKVATTSSVTTGAPDEEIVALYGFDAGNSTSGYFSVPAGMTEKYDVTHIPLGPSTAADDAVQVTAGASGGESSTITGNKNRNWVSQAIALRMAVSASAIHFVSSSSQFAFIAPANQSGLDVGGDLSIDTWVKFDSFPSGFVYNLLSRWDNSSGHGTYAFTAYDPGDGSKDLELVIVGANTVPQFCTTPISLTPGVWYHLVGTWNNSTFAENLYQNGTNIGSCTGTQPIISGRADEFDVGAFYANPGHEFYLNGLMRDARVWSKELSPTEVSNLYNAPCTVSNSNLVSWWKFAGNANDSIGSNNLTVVNSPTYVTDAAYSCSL
jgi:hypothetical protein